jgi:opacity protein-like surface antigen
MKSRLAIATLAIALLGAGVAQAAFESGTYAGKTTGQRLAVSFKATQSKLSKLSIKVKFTCSDGDSFSTVLKDFASQNIAKGRYDASYQGTSKASSYRHKGTITTRTATGSLSGSRRYNENDELDPNGTVICRTGTVRYSIKKKIAKRR